MCCHVALSSLQTRLTKLEEVVSKLSGAAPVGSGAPPPPGASEDDDDDDFDPFGSEDEEEDKQRQERLAKYAEKKAKSE